MQLTPRRIKGPPLLVVSIRLSSDTFVKPITCKFARRELYTLRVRIECVLSLCMVSAPMHWRMLTRR